MSVTLDPGLLHRIRFTPMRDIVRGRVTGRLDVNGRIDASGLPAPAKDLVRRVVRRTRLWKLERVTVADDLIAHFVDGIGSGEPAERLLQSFGDERAAARLIRRAAQRNRPIPWHVLRALGWLLVGLGIFYGLLAAYFFAGRPSPRINYVAMLNRPIEQTPPADRAWPVYRKSLLDLNLTDVDRDRAFWIMLDARPGSKRWPQLAAWLGRHEFEIGRIRHGSEKPALGFILGVGGSAYDPDLWPDQRPPISTTGEAGQSLGEVPRPDAKSVLMLSGVLTADAALARQNRDRARLLRDVDAVLGLARQMRGRGWFVASLVSSQMWDRAVDEIGQTLVETPDLLTDADLQSLAHRLAAPRVAADLIALEHERLFFDDLVQRAYTDDGDGDGRLTPEGLRFLRSVKSVGDTPSPLQPASLLLVSSRRQTTREYNELFDQVDVNFRRPRRAADWSSFQQRLDDRSVLQVIAHLPVHRFMPAYWQTHAAAERYLGHRDGVLIGIALELYRRQHYSYPSSLDALVPALLPAIPADRITGEPVHYRLTDGRPIVYSVGADRDDDGGRVPLDPGGTPDPWKAAAWDPAPHQMSDGDWVLYPEPQMPFLEVDPDALDLAY